SFLGLLFLTPRKNSTARDEFRVLARNTRSHPVLNRLASAQTNPRSAPCQPLRWLAEPGPLFERGVGLPFRNHQPTPELEARIGSPYPREHTSLRSPGLISRG